MGEGVDSWLLFWFVLLGINVNEVEGRPQQELAAGQGTGHRAGGPWTAGGDAGRQAATLDGPGGRHKHQYFSAHAHGGLAQWPHYN